MKSLRPGQQLISMACILFCVISWGSSYVAVKIGLEGFTPGQLATYRFAVASLFMLPVVVLRRLRIPNTKESLLILLVSLIGITAYHIALNYSTIHYPPNSVSFVANSMPVFVAVISTIVLKEKTSWLGWLGILIAFIGIGLLNYQEAQVFDSRMMILAIIPISSAVFFVFQKPLFKTLRYYEVMFYSIWIGTVALLIYDHSFLRDAFKASLTSNLSAIYLGVIPTVIAFNLWSYVLTKLEVSYASRYVYLVPVFTMFFSFVFLDQLPETSALLGGGVILFGVYLSQREKFGKL